MNPELQRNLWLEMSPMRLIMMPVVLSLVFAAVWSGWSFADQAELSAVSWVAKGAYFFIVIIWGTWISARLVTGEIRDRTWDGQRMSAIGPWSMVVGKLLGGTAFVWYGGLICLVPIVMNLSAEGNTADIVPEVLFRIGMGLFAHATAFFVSMLAVRRKAASSRLASFFAMVLGIGAGAWVWWVWVYLTNWPSDVQFTWFSIEMASSTFMVASLLIFAAWALVGNWVLMRHELQIRTGPWIWIGFIVFAMTYYAGQADFLGLFEELAAASHDAKLEMPQGEIDLSGISSDFLHTLRWFIAFIVATSLTFVTVLVAPKDWVQLKQARSQFITGRIPQALANLPSWLYALIAATIAAFCLTANMSPIPLDIAQDVLDEMAGFGIRVVDNQLDLKPTVFAFLFFVIRDVLIVLWFNAARNARRPDLAAFVVIWVLHNILPTIVMSAGGIGALVFVSPWPFGGGGWLQVLWPAAEAGLMLFFVISRRALVRAGSR